jgi:hypothetical protein
VGVICAHALPDNTTRLVMLLHTAQCNVDRFMLCAPTD